jgi:sec-independent protein translocase protein TatA
MGLDNPLHIAFLVVILLLVFGARRLPEIGRSLGSGMREFKQAITGEGDRQGEQSPPAAQQTLAGGTPEPQDREPVQAAPTQATSSAPPERPAA